MVPHEGPMQVPPGPSLFIHEPPLIDSVRHPSTIEIESTDFEDNLETGMLRTVYNMQAFMFHFPLND